MSGRDADPQTLATAPALSLQAQPADIPGAGAHAGTRRNDEPLHPLLHACSTSPAPSPIAGVLIGELLALTDDGLTPLVLHPGAPATAVPARATLDLHAAHIGKRLVLMFENGDPLRPVVIGLLREGNGTSLAPSPGQVEVDADGARLLVIAKQQLVLRCGKASITLTQAGKVLVEGSYILSRSTGVNRVKGGSVQLN